MWSPYAHRGDVVSYKFHFLKVINFHIIIITTLPYIHFLSVHKMCHVYQSVTFGFLQHKADLEDRLHLYRTAMGEVDETRTNSDIAPDGESTRKLSRRPRSKRIGEPSHNPPPVYTHTTH